MIIKKTFQNPILPGFYPDPTICRVGDDYYVATSTFTYFPGVPIFHSKDLVHWEQICNVLTTPEQLPIPNGSPENSETSRGIFAPTLRYHNGTFYMITTNVSDELGNFIVTAKDPRGPWSKPYPLGSAGIDPSLFFDDDGKCYYCGTQPRREGAKYFGDNEIYIQELDLETMQLVGESFPAWHGALRDMEWPEGPHIYKKDGWYYLMISEAGTAHDHAISIARSKSLFEKFEGHRGNPILTHRNLGYSYPIVNVGHPDIVETQNGEWWMVLLASRPYGGDYHRNLGRETFLVPFTWEGGWPVINPGKAIVEDQGIAPDLPLFIPSPVPAREDFNNDTLPLHMMYVRNPIKENYSYDKKESHLSLKCYTDLLSSYDTPTFVCQRQQAPSFKFQSKLSFDPASDTSKAGIAIFQSQSYNYQLLVSKKGDKSHIQLIKVEHDNVQTVCEKTLDNFYETLTLRLIADQQDLYFSYSCTGSDYSDFVQIGDVQNGRILSTDVAGGFVGTTMGIYAETGDSSADDWAHFDYMEYVNA
ncbi:glycoside hydrolase family 43 protein [Eubacterium xylanophilum]|uniref:glycoside hydrolase family 43 protein n=1 Tax=Eubacterium xylanophilum TaxID=39497 RepID=UPI0004B24949|nr:glycoside hydrolase family 43 protein [Eubacterium xylanophilum]